MVFILIRALILSLLQVINSIHSSVSSVFVCPSEMTLSVRPDSIEPTDAVTPVLVSFGLFWTKSVTLEVSLRMLARERVVNFFGEFETRRSSVSYRLWIC